MAFNPCYGRGGAEYGDKFNCSYCQAIYDCFKLIFKHSNKVTKQESIDAKIRQRIVRSSRYINAGNKEYPDIMKIR